MTCAFVLKIKSKTVRSAMKYMNEKKKYLISNKFKVYIMYKKMKIMIIKIKIGLVSLSL